MIMYVSPLNLGFGTFFSFLDALLSFGYLYGMILYFNLVRESFIIVALCML